MCQILTTCNIIFRKKEKQPNLNIKDEAALKLDFQIKKKCFKNALAFIFDSSRRQSDNFLEWFSGSAS